MYKYVMQNLIEGCTPPKKVETWRYDYDVSNATDRFIILTAKIQPSIDEKSVVDGNLNNSLECVTVRINQTHKS